jgi:phenazine biosynthesis protein phzE
MPGLLSHVVRAPDATAFAVLRRASGPGVEVFVGDVVDVARLADIPLPDSADGAAAPQVLAAVPYRQVTERGFVCHDDGAPLRCLLVRGAEVLDLGTALALLPDEDPGVTAHGFDVDDDAYAETVRRVVEDEIGRGEGANFVIRRDHRSAASASPAVTALRVLRRLLVDEPHAYWTFVLHAGDLTLVGATPERHVSVTGGEVLMNPISGTYRFPPTGAATEGLLDFLADHKETEELFMVVDEELKMMSRVCPGGGEVLGPYLNEMSALAHTEYLLRGTTDLDPRAVLRETMFAPTVTGSPVQNAARVIAAHETTGRGHYSGVLALFGRDGDGGCTVDAPILIRTASIDAQGGIRVGVGATLVRSSSPDAEVAETHAKAAGILRALGVLPRPDGSTRRDAGPRLADRPGVAEALDARNHALADFWLHRSEGAGTALSGRTAVLVDAEDTWTDMLAVMLRQQGMTTVVRPWAEVGPVPADALLVAGPGPGDPRDVRVPRIAAVHRLVADRLAGGRPLLAVCLSHQVLAAQLGLPVAPLPAPHQGTQREVDLFGRRARVGFYNTFTAMLPTDGGLSRPDVTVAADPETAAVLAIRGPGFASVQFHLESLLSPDGADILRDLAAGLVGAEPAATRRTIDA